MKRLISFIALVVVLFSVTGVVTHAEEYTGNEYYVRSLTRLAFRDSKGNQIGVVDEDEVLTVLGVDPRDSKRDWVLWCGQEGSVIRTGTESLGISVAAYAKKAVARTEVNLRVPETYEIIALLPMGSEVTVLGQDPYHEDRWCVDYQGTTGSIVKSSLYLFKNTDIIIVDIEAQSVIMLKDGRVWCYSKVVTGMQGTNDTPKGVYSIRSMERDATLNGPGYSTPVKYWMPFHHGYGLHDLKRSAYGGSIYTTKGSHGCVNMPEHIAKAIFENAYVGYIVMVR